QLKTGGTDIETSDTVPNQDIEVRDSSIEKGHIELSEKPQPEGETGRSGRRLSTFLRRGSASSHHIGMRTKKLHELGQVEDLEAVAERQKKEAARKLRQAKAPIGRTLKYARNDAGLFLIAVVLAMVQGATYPGMSQVLSRALTALSSSTVDPNFTSETDRYSLYFLIIALVACVGYGGGIISFMVVGERVTRTVRHLSYKAILSQEMAFFDRSENSTGALATQLAIDGQQMFDLVSLLILTVVASMTTIGIGLGFSFAATWQMSLAVFAAIPIIGVGHYLHLKSLTGFGEKTRKAFEQSGQVAGEAIANIRTVASLAKEDAFEARYAEVTEEPHRFAINKAVVGSLGFAVSQGVGFWAYAIGLYAGYRLVEAGTIDWSQMMNCMFGVVFTASTIGHISSDLPKYVRGKQSAINIYELLDK
ncbi:Multidrug resistance protein 1, partial [Lunasporangiospora selenospora]